MLVNSAGGFWREFRKISEAAGAHWENGLPDGCYGAFLRLCIRRGGEIKTITCLVGENSSFLRHATLSLPLPTPL